VNKDLYCDNIPLIIGKVFKF